MTVSLFSPERLQQVVTDTLPDDGDPRRHIVVGTVDQDGAQVVAAFTRSPASIWELQVAARHEWTTGENSLGGKVLIRW